MPLCVPAFQVAASDLGLAKLSPAQRQMTWQLVLQPRNLSRVLQSTRRCLLHLLQRRGDRKAWPLREPGEFPLLGKEGLIGDSRPRALLYLRHVRETQS